MAADVPALDPPPWREVLRGRWGRLTAGLLLLEAVVAVQSLVVATIMPDIRRDLGMVELYGLAFTVSGLATLASIPIAGRAVDRVGPRATLLPALGVFSAGLLTAATAPAMPVLLVGQFLMGAGGGALYAISLGTVATSYPDRLRPRVMALLATMWILPGLIGPPFGALVAATVGWRWTYLAPLPILVVAWLMVAPAMGPHRAQPTTALGRGEIRRPLQLMVGAGLVFTALTIVHPWALAILALGAAISIPALVRIAPPGTFHAARGLGAAAASAFLLSTGFLAMDAFLTLMLTDVRGLSLAAASLAVTAASVTWAGGSLWQSGRADRIPLGRLAQLGTLIVIVGQAGVIAALSSTVPVALAYLGWGLVGLGMGIVFPTIPLAAMRLSSAESRSAQLSSVLLMDMLGVSTGAGLGGGAVAVAAAAGAPLARGIGTAFAVGLGALLLLLWTGRRIDPRQRSRGGDATEASAAGVGAGTEPRG
jgi:MFS family permease